jgi:hypothetical protein
VGKPIFRIKVLADTGVKWYLISLSTATKHGCKIRETDVRLSVANRTKIDVAGRTSLQVAEKGHLAHTIVTIVLPNFQQTIVGWQDLRAMGVISSEWPVHTTRGLGFALVHTEVVNGKEMIRLVTCGSRSLNPAEKSYAVVKLEFLAVKYAVEKCRYYLLGMQKFTVWSNHRPLVGI